MTLSEAYQRLNAVAYILTLSPLEIRLLSVVVHDLHVAIYEADREHERVCELIRQAHRAGRRAVDEAHKEFGYDSLRFADVRHGWLETMKPLWSEVTADQLLDGGDEEDA